MARCNLPGKTINISMKENIGFSKQPAAEKGPMTPQELFNIEEKVLNEIAAIIGRKEGAEKEKMARVLTRAKLSSQLATAFIKLEN